jgi:hypothetical protein
MAQQRVVIINEEHAVLMGAAARQRRLGVTLLRQEHRHGPLRGCGRAQ